MPDPVGYLDDAPINDPDADRLRRKPFADRIADTIASRTDPESLVVGLYGQWGEGKTTVLNFIEQRLGETDTVECVRFNPWLYQGESQLLLSFFETLSTAVGRSLRTRQEEMGRWLRRFGAALGTVSVGVGFVNVAPGAALQDLGESLSSVDILEKRRELEAVLAESGMRILIMIDDIDRLDDSEIATVFKLVKLAADFKHTAYVLAFDQDVVTKALAKRYADSEGSGSSFIEKIVQVPIELPRADEGVLQSMTLQAMTAATEGVELEDADVNRFSTVFGRYLAPHIGTPRMVKRIANAVEFVVPLVAGEVNLVDLLLIETLGVLFPQVYRKMPALKDVLLGKYFDFPANDVEQIVRKRLEPIFEGLADDGADHVKGALCELFPRIERLYSNHHYGAESIPSWVKAQRVCAPSYFDRYFSYGIPIGDLADSDLRRFLANIKEETPEEAAQNLAILFEKASAKRFIEKIRPLETTFDAETARAVAYAISDTSNKLPDPLAGPMSGIVSAFGQAAMHIANALVRMPSEERLPVVRRIISASPSLPFASEVLRWSRIVSGQDVAEDARALTEDQVSELEVALAERIAEEAGEQPLFISMPRYAPQLYYDWLRGAGRLAVEQHLASAIAGDIEASLALVRAFMPTAWSMETGLPVGSQVERNTYDSIAGLLDPQALVDVFGEAFPNTIAAELPDDTYDLGPDDERIALRWVRIHRAVQTQTVVNPDEAPPPDL
jgi:KAP family P-loop domain